MSDAISALHTTGNAAWLTEHDPTIPQVLDAAERINRTFKLSIIGALSDTISAAFGNKDVAKRIEAMQRDD